MTTGAYLILQNVGDTEHGRAQGGVRAHTGLRLIFENAAIQVFADPQTRHVALGSTGVVLGHLYPRRGSARLVEQLDRKTAEAVMTMHGAPLLEAYWGEYVAVASDGTTTFVLRDPSGAMPCLFSRCAGTTVFASDAALLHRQADRAPVIDLGGVARYLFTGLPGPDTALENITELVPGTSARCVNGHVAIAQSWSPWTFAGFERRSRESRIKELRDALDQAISALVDRYPRLLAGVSGGLDSSIVLTLARRFGAELEAVTMITDDGDGDESAYAGLLCAALEVPMAKARYDIADVNVLRAASPHLPRPTSRAEAQAFNAAMVRHSGNALAFLSGNGGDNVFGYSQSANALVDRFALEGVGRGCLRTLADICALTGCSPLSALRAALRRRAPGRWRYAWTPEPLFLEPGMVQTLQDMAITHPWLEAPDGVPPGKTAHVAQLLKIQPHLQANAPALGMPVLTPLMSQPVLEACLSVPSWEWCSDGRDRALARAACTSLLPGAILRRRTKGGPDSFCSTLIQARRDDIADRVLNGRLARANMLDRGAIERCLSGNGHIAGFEYVRLLSLLEAEAWSDHWSAGVAP